MGASTTRRKVKLPGGRRAIEYETTFVGGSETQAVYQYCCWRGIPMNTSKYEKDYWGRIVGVEVV